MRCGPDIVNVAGERTCLRSGMNAARRCSQRLRDVESPIMRNVLVAAAFVVSPLLFAQGVSITHAVTPIPPEVARTQTVLTAKLGDSAKAKLQQVVSAVEAKSVATATADKLDAAIRKSASDAFAGTNLNAADFDALVFIVATSVAKENETSLRDQIAEMEKIAKQRDDIRKRLANLKVATTGTEAATAARPAVSLVSVKSPPIAPVRAPAPLPADATAAAMQSRIDELNELTNAAQLRLQAMMDHRSKAMDILSNLMKKVSDSQGTVLSSLK